MVLQHLKSAVNSSGLTCWEDFSQFYWNKQNHGLEAGKVFQQSPLQKKKIGGHFCLVMRFREQQRNWRHSEHQWGYPGSYSPYLRSELLADRTCHGTVALSLFTRDSLLALLMTAFLAGSLIPVTQCQSHSDSIRDLLFQSLLPSASKGTEPSYVTIIHPTLVPEHQSS